MKGVTRSIRRRLGPLGLSLAAAAITAAAFAAFSLAAGDKGGSEEADAPGPPGGPGIMLHAEGLSEEDQQKLEDFRACMEDQGLPAPPRFREGDRPPEPPSREEFEQMRERLQKAHEACQDKLPEELRERGFPHFGPGPCGPPPGVEGLEDRKGDGENEEQSFVVPAPPPSGTS